MNQPKTPETKDSRQIETQLDETRGAISNDIKALGSKLSSDNLKHEAKIVLTDVKDSAKEVLASAKDSAKDALVDAAGSAKQTIVDAADAAKNTVVEAASAAKDTVVDATSSAKESLLEAKEVVTDKLHEYKDVAVETLDDVSITARRAGTASWTFAKQNAVPLALIGLGSAWLIAGSKTRTASAPRRVPTLKSPAVHTAYSNEYDSAPRGRIATYGGRVVDERDYDSSRSHAPARSAKSIGGSAAHATAEVKDAVADLTDRAQGLYDRAGDKITDVAAHATDRAQDLVGRAGEALKRGTLQTRDMALYGLTRVRDGSRELAEENPLAVGAAALAVGIGIGLMLPSTSKENALLGATRDHWIDEAREAAQGVRAAAQTLGETAKETAEAII
jgi:hypothetical protein